MGSLRVIYNPEDSTLTIRPIDSNGDSGHGITLPEVVGVKWHADQSCNELILSGSLNRANYTFRPVDDLPLLAEYLDQIEDFYRSIVVEIPAPHAPEFSDSFPVDRWL